MPLVTVFWNPLVGNEKDFDGFLFHIFLNSFGSKVRGTRTGIFFNSEMDDFAVPGGSPNAFGFLPSGVNEIEPGKRPQSSMTPSIILDRDNDVYMVIGSSGGSRIITAISQVCIE